MAKVKFFRSFPLVMDSGRMEMLEALLAICHGVAAAPLTVGVKNVLKMNRSKMLCVILMCFGFSLVNAAAQTQPAAGSPGSAPTTPPPPGETGTAAATPPIVATPLADPQTPQEFLARARQLSDLEASGIPFHLKATYVASGDTEFTGNGTYEEWWQSKDLWRTEATLGNYKYVVIKNGTTTRAYATGPYLPLRLRQAMDSVLVRYEADAGTSRQ